MAVNICSSIRGSEPKILYCGGTEFDGGYLFISLYLFLYLMCNDVQGIKLVTYIINISQTKIKIIQGFHGNANLMMWWDGMIELLKSEVLIIN